MSAAALESDLDESRKPERPADRPTVHSGLINPGLNDTHLGSENLVSNKADVRSPRGFPAEEHSGLQKAQGAVLPPGDGQKPVSRLVSGTSTLAAGMVIERGFGFLANLLAARLGGSATFGAYSLAITTANNIGTYTAGGIGSTATRFSGKYPRGSAGYPTLVRALFIVSLISAALALAVLWAGAGPLAHYLRKDSLSILLRWAAFSAAGTILIECCRGFLLGQQRLAGMLTLSVLFGVTMITLLPLASRLGPTQMIVCQGSATLIAVATCLILYKRLGLAPPANVEHPLALKRVLKEVWSFGFVQLSGLVGVNAAGWWLTSLVARADTTLVQMSFYMIASQLRNMAGLLPGLLAQSSYAVMAAERRAEIKDQANAVENPDRVLALCTYLATFASFALAGGAIIVLPWGLRLLYGGQYAAASAATAFALATAVIHMGNAPASARLTIVSLKLYGIINTAWAVLVMAAATVFLFHGGSAWVGTAIVLGAHVSSAALVLTGLSRKGVHPRGFETAFWLGAAGALALSSMELLRSLNPGHILAWTSSMSAVFLAIFGAYCVLGRQYGWLPKFTEIVDLSQSLIRKLSQTSLAIPFGVQRGRVS